jgi:hypothetical protein
LLAEVGQPHYVVYKTAAQFVHPATRCLALVRDLESTHANEIPVTTYAYRTTQRDWTTAVLLGAESIWFGLNALARCMQAPPVSPRASSLFGEIVRRVRMFA